MDPLERQVLSRFDRPGGRSLPLADLGNSVAVRPLVIQLVARGLLRPGAAPDSYERTEAGRLELTGPRDVTLYTRPGCHLCEEAKAQLAPLLQEFDARLTEINIDEDPQLRAEYNEDVPVIFVGKRKAAKHHVDLVRFRRQLGDASA